MQWYFHANICYRNSSCTKTSLDLGKQLHVCNKQLLQSYAEYPC